MPYISDHKRRGNIKAGSLPRNAGELNFKLTSILIDYMDARELSYQIINDIMGALEGAKSEFYRRVALPYEDAKINENGDVYI